MKVFVVLVTLLSVTTGVLAQQSPPANPQQPSPEMQSLAKAFEGTWSVHEQFEPSESAPNGRTGHATQVWRRGPGGFTFMEEFRDDSPSGEFGLALMWWDKTRGFKNTGMWCDKAIPKSCMVFVDDPSASFQWDGKQQVINNEFRRNGKTYSYHEVLTDLTPTSFLQTIDIGEKGGPLKRFLTIHATRIATESQLPPEVSKQDVAAATPDMQKLFKVFQGRWSYRVDRQNGESGAGEQIWRAGPGGVELIEELKGANGGPFGLSVTWWDAVDKGYRAIWCDNTLPTGCIVMSKLAQWEGQDFVLRDKYENAGKQFESKEVFSNITPTAYTQTILEAELGSEFKRIMTIHATKIAEDGQIPKKSQKLTMPGPDVQNLMLSTWAIRVRYPTSDKSTGETGEGTEVWRPGPGGRSVIEEYREKNSNGEVEGLGVAWWDEQAQGQRFVWCENTNPDGCYVSKEVAKWNGERLEWKEEQETSGKKRVYSEIFKDISSDSFTQVLQEGEPGEALKDTAIISAKRISHSSISSRHETDLGEPESFDTKPKLEMQKLSDLLAGRWSGMLTTEPGAHERGRADETWRLSPGGLTLVEENRLSTPKGSSFDYAAVWWNRKAQKYQGIWCAEINDEGCSGFDAQAESDRVTMTGEWEQTGHRRAWREVFSRPDQNSSIQTLEVGEPGGELKRVSAITATRIAEGSTELSNVPAQAELRADMAERRRANIEGDVDTVANSMTDDYVQTDINGYRQDKTTWLNEYFKPLADLISAGKFRWDEYDQKNLQFRFYGDCAIVTGELQAKGTGAKFGPHHTWVADANASFSGILHFTHVYIKQNGKWMLAALHNQIPLPTDKSAK